MRIGCLASLGLLILLPVTSCKKDTPDPNLCKEVNITFSVDMDSKGALLIFNVQGGSPPYQYAVDNLPYQQSEKFGGPYQDGNSYMFRIKDSNGCEGIEERTFQRIKGCDGASTVSDIDGNTYCTVQIGSQEWMAENLKTTRYADGSGISNVTDNGAWASLSTAAWCNYGNDVGNDAFYGKLYNWYTVADSRGLCPVGWHVPTDDEWKKMEMHLGMSQSEANEAGWRGKSTNVDDKMKATSGWNWNGYQGQSGNGTNESGFTGLPGGSRNGYDGVFGTVGDGGYWWSSSESSTWEAWDRGLDYQDDNVSRLDVNKHAGLSVRCVRD